MGLLGCCFLAQMNQKVQYYIGFYYNKENKLIGLGREGLGGGGECVGTNLHRKTLRYRDTSYILHLIGIKD